MGHNTVSGGGGHSSCGSHLDFVSYWADKTVEEAVFQEQQLRLQKAQPLPSREYDVLNVHFIKPPRSVKSSGRRRNKTAKVSTKRHRSRSPYTGVSPSKRQKKWQKYKPCGLRIAELAVPTKRHCLETWKNKYNILPDYMIERLRQHILDEQPVVQIADAIHCFKRKCKWQKKTKRDKTQKIYNKAIDGKKMVRNPSRKNEVTVLGAIFGHRIAKKLIAPLNIILNSDLEKIAGVISYDIGALMRKSKHIDTKNKMYNVIERDIVKKVTIWVSGVLDESSDKILEDQLKDFEEEAGPVLDFIDDLVDNVLDLSIPIPETFEESFTSESDESGAGESLLDKKKSEELDLKYDIYENIKDHLKNEIVTLINSIGQEAYRKTDEYPDVGEGSIWQSSGDVEANDINKNNTDYIEAEEGTALEQEGDEKGITSEPTDEEGITLEPTDEEEITLESTGEEEITLGPTGEEEITLEPPNEKGFTLEPTEGNEDLRQKPEANLRQSNHAEDTAFDDVESEETNNISIIANEHLQNENKAAENEDQEAIIDISETYDENSENANDEALQISENAEEKNKEYIESEDAAQPKETVDILLENTDHITETFADAIENNSEEIDRTVTFGETITDEQKSNVDLNWKASIEYIEFAEPNDDLLSDADESWPEDIQPPVLRPSQSVSKSITSLGRIREVDEKSDKPEEEENDEAHNFAKTEHLDKESQTKLLHKGEQDEKKTTIESIKSKDETASKDSGKKDRRSINKRISSSKKSKLPSQKSTPSTSQRSPSKFSKIEMSPSPKPIFKAPGKIKGKLLKAKSLDTESKRISQSANDQEIYIKTKDNNMKTDYRVNVKTAPDWINRTFGEPNCSCVHIPSKSKVKPKVNENVVRRWCQDLEQGYENLRMWNDWVANTTRTVYMLQRETGKSYCPKSCSNKEWIKLKRNINKDAHLWTKLNQHTRERLKFYRKMYQTRSETPTKYFMCCAQPK